MADIFDFYTLAQAWDEMFAAPGRPRPPYLSLFATLQPLSGTDLRFRADQLARPRRTSAGTCRAHGPQWTVVPSCWR